MRTMSQSDSTRVPPVTAMRSPPLSRMTGADSPVMALSSTEATPSITSPSPGIKSPASTSTTSPLRSVGGGDRLELPPCAAAARRLAWVSRAGRGAACRPGPCRALGHRLGEVGEEHGEPEPERRSATMNRPVPRRAGESRWSEEHGRQHRADLDHEHHRVASPWCRGSSLRTNRQAAPQQDRRDRRATAGLRVVSVAMVGTGSSSDRSCLPQ